MGRYQGLIGLVVLLGIAVALSNNRRKINPRIVFWGLGLQIGFAFLILRTPIGYPFFSFFDELIQKLLSFAYEGSRFLFRPLNPQYVGEFQSLTDEGQPIGAPLHLRPVDGKDIAPMVQTFAFVVLPTIVFFSALLSVLYHLGIMQRVVHGIAWVMQRTMGTSGAETLSVSGNIFVGQTEAPLLIRPFIHDMTRSELLTVMVGGFATVAGAVMAMYVGMLKQAFPDLPIAGHLMAASVMSAPAALVVAKILYPETDEPKTRGTLHVSVARTSRNLFEAIGDGATVGMKLALNIGAMLIAFIALVALVNSVLSLGPTLTIPGVGWELRTSTSLEELLGILFRPLAWCIGAPWDEADTLGTLMGEKVAVTELIAFQHLSELPADQQLSERTAIIASYALCGFANFASIGIQLGGIGSIAPERKGDLAQLAFKAMIGGAIASWMTASIAGVLI